MDDITHRNIYQSQFNPTSSSPLTLNGLSINLPESFPGPPLLRRALNSEISPWWGTPRGLVTSACVMMPDCSETPGWVSSRRHLDSLWPGFSLYTKMIPDPLHTNLVPLARRSLESRQSVGVTINIFFGSLLVTVVFPGAFLVFLMFPGALLVFVVMPGALLVYEVTPGARFSKLPVITGPVKLFCFPLRMGVSKGLKIVQ